ncbi:hypothetical protein SAMN04487969_11945 [Paenibacillus algorifonticola]|uniref:Uncharacterized protein n=1 Tax=Paenibacillus algorifonticola TaxID=684063 RepID=A0A1I2H045_9BACL|nr:hypothetical protein [Paenibacillus algorifonticola]SFF22780.1 hypothetical protein SAMN04487969_11945 [Paenibacillus algorifonticola]
MNKSTVTYWMWTELAERLSAERGIHRKSGDTVMESHEGRLVRRLTVPRSWVDKGYVVEAPVEQPTLF